MDSIIGLNECLLVTMNVGRALASTRLTSADWLMSLQESLQLPVKSYDQEIPDLPMIDQIIRELVQVMGSENRNRLLIAGADVESHITFLTLRALAEGFDVYLLSDLMASQDRQFARIFQMRLFEAGALPTTMGQFLLEWQTAESDASLADRLQLLRASFLLRS
jgi:hypothetical protein